MKVNYQSRLTLVLVMLLTSILVGCDKKDEVKKTISILKDKELSNTDFAKIVNDKILSDTSAIDSTNFLDFVSKDSSMLNEFYNILYSRQYKMFDTIQNKNINNLILQLNERTQKLHDPITLATSNAFVNSYTSNTLPKLNQIQPNNTTKIKISVAHLQTLLRKNVSASFLRVKVIQGDNNSIAGNNALNYLNNYNNKLYLLYTLVDATYNASPNEHYDLNAILPNIQQIPQNIYNNLITNFDNLTSGHSLKSKLLEVSNPNTESIFIPIAELNTYLSTCRSRNANFTYIDFIFTQVVESDADVQNTPKYRTILTGKNNYFTIISKALDNNNVSIGMLEYDVNTLCPPGNCNN